MDTKSSEEQTAEVGETCRTNERKTSAYRNLVRRREEKREIFERPYVAGRRQN
jgi:hypothetical protein